jgi:hypothetical protein
MKRRQFLQSIAATAGVPLMPAGLLGTAQVPSSLYAKAVSYVASDACFSPSHLMSTLGLNDTSGRAVLNQLRTDGLVAEMGNTGLMYSKTVYAKQAKIAAAALKNAFTAPTNESDSDILKKAQDQFQKVTTQPLENADLPEPDPATGVHEETQVELELSSKNDSEVTDNV